MPPTVNTVFVYSQLACHGGDPVMLKDKFHVLLELVEAIRRLYYHSPHDVQRC